MTKQTEPEADVLAEFDGSINHCAQWLIQDAQAFEVPLWMARERFLDAYDAAAEKADA